MIHSHATSPGRTLVRLAPLALAAIACSESAPTSHAATGPPGPELSAAPARPFRATYVITPQLLFPGDPAYPARCPTGPTDVAATATGQGRGTHLGRFTETESNCIDFATLTLTLGEFTFTAANGDQLSGEFEGSASTDPPPPNAELSCTWEVTGGTGRFVDARGAGECVDSRQLGDGRSLIGFEGWIAY